MYVRIIMYIKIGLLSILNTRKEIQFLLKGV